MEMQVFTVTLQFDSPRNTLHGNQPRIALLHDITLTRVLSTELLMLTGDGERGVRRRRVLDHPR